jgi:peptide-methionine (S)-S-oxide reductase
MVIFMISPRRRSLLSRSGVWPVGESNMTTEKAVLAAGCFWGMQDMFRRLRGVVSARVGYTGRDLPNPSYCNHQGHAEAIEIIFDPAVVTYRAILERSRFTTRQLRAAGERLWTKLPFPPFSTRRTAEGEALEAIDEIETSGVWPGPVVTEINPEQQFWQAEPEHQEYLQRHPAATAATSSAELATAVGSSIPEVANRPGAGN